MSPRLIIKGTEMRRTAHYTQKGWPHEAPPLKVWPCLGASFKVAWSVDAPAVATFTRADFGQLFADMRNAIQELEAKGWSVAGEVEAPSYPGGRVLAPWGIDGEPLLAPFHYQTSDDGTQWRGPFATAFEAWADAFVLARQLGLME